VTAVASSPTDSPAPAPSRWAGDLFLGPVTESDVDDAGSDPDLATLVDLLDDEHVRTILAATSAEPLSAAELSDRCGVSPSAIYRRLDRLVDAGLLDERTRPRSDGHHDTVYVAALERFELVVDDGDLSWTVDRAEPDVADELTRLWGQF
jgi:predicted transcriptional regulator